MPLRKHIILKVNLSTGRLAQRSTFTRTKDIKHTRV